MFSFLILFHVLFIVNVSSFGVEISDKRLCANEECTEIMGVGKTIRSYVPPSKDSRLLSFKSGQDVKIYSLEAGSNPNLVGVEINGKRGYIPKETFRETSMKVTPKLERDTEKTVNPDPTKPYVFEGTTIYGDTMNTVTETQPNMTDTNQETQPLNLNSIPKTVQEGAVPTVVTTETSNVISDVVPSSEQQPIDSSKTDDEIKHNEVLVEQKNEIIVETLVTEVPLEPTEDTIQHVQPQIQKDQLELENVLISGTNNTDSNAKNLSTASSMSAGDDGSGGEEEEEEGSTEEIEDEDGIVEEEVHEEANTRVIEDSFASSAEPTQPQDSRIQIDSNQLLELHNETTTSPSESNNVENHSPPRPEQLQPNIEDVGLENTQLDDSIPISISEASNVENELTSPMVPQQPLSLEIGTENQPQSETATFSSVSHEIYMKESTPPTDDQQQVFSESGMENPPQSETATLSSVSHENDTNVDTPQEQTKELNDQDTQQDQSATTIGYDQQNIEVPLPPILSQVNEENLQFTQSRELPSYTDEQVLHHSENQNEMENSNYANSQQTFKEEAGNEIEQLNKLETETVNPIESHKHDLSSLISQHVDDKSSCSADPLRDCDIGPQDFRAAYDTNNIYKIPNSAILTVLVIAAVTVVTFLWGYIYMEKRGRESNLVGKINNIQKEYLIVQKQNEMLQDKLEDVEVQFNEKANAVSSEMLAEVQEQLEQEKCSRSTLELQIQNLEKELENSTEVGLELNRMLSEFLNSENGSETLVANIEQLQRQLVEQQGIINTYNENLSMKETENHELRLEVDINNTKVTELQSELNKMTFNLLKFEEDKEQLQSIYEGDLQKVKEELESRKGTFTKEKIKLKEQLQELNDKCEQVQKDYELKCNEYMILKEGISQIKKIENNGDALKSLLDMSAVQAELLQLRKEKQLLMEQLQDERNKSGGYEVKCQSVMKDLENFKERYDEADREKVEAVTKLQVLDKYFKEREAHLQKELNKQESMWIEKQGEATSTIERIKYMQEELQNYKAQNESLKQEILEQEVQMKSQISVLEKKAHENWVTARQAERKLEDAKQEAAQLRNRLTLRERSFAEDKIHNRVQSPLEQNGEIPVSPSHIPNDTATSPLLFGARENLTISPPLPGLPFLPPPPGVPFMPPTLGGVPLPPPGFMPPPPSLMPGDHRPPPLGRISSPPLNSRYSPDRGFSPYSRNSPSPTSDDDYDRIPHPPMYRGYNSYNRDDRREIHRPPPVRGNARNNKGGGHSSASTNSNDSLDKINRHNSKV